MAQTLHVDLEEPRKDPAAFTIATTGCRTVEVVAASNITTSQNYHTIRLFISQRLYHSA